MSTTDRQMDTHTEEMNAEIFRFLWCCVETRHLFVEAQMFLPSQSTVSYFGCSPTLSTLVPVAGVQKLNTLSDNRLPMGTASLTCVKTRYVSLPWRIVFGRLS